ncbi:sugar-binding transcriptional regulator [Bauldia sp.]|uniref:sugar-binding transcriptional regulator n=1 Tax=Bauldia sp. TaxID=2575872 RepID=UPI0025BAF9CA|nr:sugar-binding domain-containing protein [Bauldia sp.]
MDPASPTSRTLLYAVARLHYEKDLSQRQIAEQMQISTATVSRLIKRAREEGIVRIEIGEFVGTDELAEQLREALGLAHVAIAQSAPNPGAMAAIADPVGQLLRKTGLGAGSVLGLGWGRTIWEVIQIGLPQIHGVTTVPLCGGIPEAAAHFQVGEMVRLAATQLGGTPKFLHVPYLLADETRKALTKDPRIRESLELWDRLDTVIVGVGRPHGGASSTTDVSLTPKDAAIDHAAGDVLLRYFDATGRRVHWQEERMLVAIEPKQLLKVPFRIGAAVSGAKAISIVGAARSGLINALATDTSTAAHILQIARAE